MKVYAYEALYTFTFRSFANGFLPDFKRNIQQPTFD